MIRASCCGAALLIGSLSAVAAAEGFEPITKEMLTNPPPGEWLMLNRTYDEQRYSPLNQINRDNVASLRMAWSRGLPAGTVESVPLVAQGVMYVVSPGVGV